MLSYKRRELTIANINRCRIAREHVFRNVNSMREFICTIWVVTQAEKDAFDVEFKNLDWVSVEVIKDYTEKAPILMSEFLGTTADLFCITWDDHGVYEDCYTNAINAMLGKFPARTPHNKQFSYDGVVGMSIVNYPKHFPWRSGFGPYQLIGSGVIKSFKSAYPDKTIFCPDYKRICWECEFAAYIRFHNAIWYCHDARVDHWRPDQSTNSAQWKPDKSHVEGRMGSMERDRQMYLERRHVVIIGD